MAGGYGAFAAPGSDDSDQVMSLIAGSRSNAIEVNKGTTTTSVRRNIFFAAVLLLAGITSVMYASSRSPEKSKISSGIELNLEGPLMGDRAGVLNTKRDSSTTALDGKVKGLKISVSNEYGSTSREGTSLPYPFLESRTLVEPYKTHTVTVSGFTELVHSGAEFTYQVISTNTLSVGKILHEGTLTMDSSGKAVMDVYIESKGYANLQVIATLASGEKQAFSFPLALKYVRRELTTLSDADRKIFMDAMWTLWSVNTREGVERYGSDYKSIHYFAQIHVDATMYPDCDMLHDGRGFIVGHLYMEAYFEQSLQAVDPRVAMHYLDYGKLFSSDQFKTHLAKSQDGGSYTALFSDQWFGSSDPETGLLLDSKWKDFEIPLITSKFFEDNAIPESKFWASTRWDSSYPEGFGNHGISPLGYQRGMWSFSNSNKLQRYHKVYDVESLNSVVDSFSSYKGVNCYYLNEFATEYVIGNTFESMSVNIEYHAHGPAHFAFGGSGGERAQVSVDRLRSKYGWDDSALIEMSWAAHHTLKNSFSQLYQTEIEDPATTVLFKTKMPVLDEQFGYDWDKLNANDGAYVKSKDEYAGMMLEPDYSLVEDYAKELGRSVEKQWFLAFFATVSEDTESSFYRQWYAKVMGDEFSNDELADINMLLSNSMQLEGDISSNGAPLDPVFWMLHGEVFRLLQRVAIGGAMSDTSLTTVNPRCAGHSALGTNPWLKGYHFSTAGESHNVKMQELTNKDLASYLDPNSFHFNDKFDFIYDAADYEWCPEFNEALGNYASEKMKEKATASPRANNLGGM